MKKNSWAILSATTAYSFLFYHQHAGLNFLLFTLLLIALLIWRDRSCLKNKWWVFLAVLSLISASFILIHDSDLAVLANITTLVLLSASSIHVRSSFLTDLFMGIYSIAGSVVFLILNAVTPEKPRENKNTNYLLSYSLALVAATFFFLIYKNANPLFEDYTKKISIEPQLVFFTLGGFLLVYGFICHQRIRLVDEWEEQVSSPIDVIADERDTASKYIKPLAFLFVLLNLMLLFINLLDVNYLYLGKGMPDGVTHKQFVHNGVGMLIFSIVLAMGIILFFFRGALNFNTNNKHVKWLIYLWIMQNLLMVFSTVIRNNLYVHDGLLTYKRIGVYYWLLMAALGLVTTFIKVMYVKPNWYLVRSNSFFALLILTCSAGIDWDKFISLFNIRNIKSMAMLDKRYLVSLSETNIIDLYAIRNHPDFNTDSTFHYNNLYDSNTAGLDQKTFCFYKESETGDWRSFSLRRQKVSTDLEVLRSKNTFTSMDLSSSNIKNLKPIFKLNELKELNLKNTYLGNMRELRNFKKLESLTLSSIKVKDIASLKELRLKKLTIYNTDTTTVRQLKDSLPGYTIFILKEHDKN